MRDTDRIPSFRQLDHISLHQRIDAEEDCDDAASMGVNWERTPEQRIRDQIKTQDRATGKRIQAMWDFIIAAYAVLMDGAGYVLITSVALAAATTIYNAIWPQLTPWATFTTASIYVLLMVLQIMRRNREQQEWSLPEIGDRIACIDDAISELRNLVERNYV